MSGVDLRYFPGWTRKAITFTIDDGNVSMDRKFIDIIKDSQLKGTFNITSNFALKHDDADTLRTLYQGFEIANHVKYHPFAFGDGMAPTAEEIAQEPFPGAANADVRKVYTTDDAIPGLYYRYCKADDAWQKTATAEAYIAFADAGKQELEEIFGQGSVQGFVWPYSRQENSQLIAQLRKQYVYLRTAGIRFGREETTFDLPQDWSNWAINTRQYNLLERGRQFEELADEGKLKWMVFGVHSSDFERDSKWEELRQFADQYGNRPQEFWYATNIEIFRYVAAIRAVTVHDGVITNPSDVMLHIKVDDRPLILMPNSTTHL